MTVINRQKDALTTSMSLDSFGKAMAQIDLSGVPPNKRLAAIKDHMMRIAINTVHDRDAATEIAAARLLRLKHLVL